jgi:Uncharacterized low-complexity proteins
LANSKKEPKRPNPKNLKFHVGLFLALGVAVGGIIFALIHWRLGPNPDPTQAATHVYEIIRTTVAILGALTVGAAAIIQYRKHIVLETQAQLERDSRHSERLTKAIDHLGNEKLSIRKGAIYELKHLAEDSDKIRHDIIRILEGHIREKIEDKAREIQKTEKENKEVNCRPEEDVFVAANIATRLCKNFEDQLDLRGLQAPRVNLHKINLSEANLTSSNLIEACLIRAVLMGVDLTDAYLIGALLWGTHLTGATFTNARINKYTALDDGVREKYFSDAIWVDD